MSLQRTCHTRLACDKPEYVSNTPEMSFLARLHNTHSPTPLWVSLRFSRFPPQRQDKRHRLWPLIGPLFHVRSFFCYFFARRSFISLTCRCKNYSSWGLSVIADCVLLSAATGMTSVDQLVISGNLLGAYRNAKIKAPAILRVPRTTGIGLSSGCVIVPNE